MKFESRVEWFLVILGLGLVAACIYLGFLQVGTVFEVGWGVTMGSLIAGGGAVLLDKEMRWWKLLSIAVLLVGLIILIDATRVAWLGEQWPGGFNGNQFLVKLIAGPVLLGIAKILSDYRLRHPDAFVGLFFVGDWFLFRSVGPLPINLASWSVAMTFIAWFFFALSLYVPFERSEL